MVWLNRSGFDWRGAVGSLEWRRHINSTIGWQPHTARAAISAQRKAGCEIARSDTDKGSVYRIVDQGGDQ